MVAWQEEGPGGYTETPSRPSPRSAEALLDPQQFGRSGFRHDLDFPFAEALIDEQLDKALIDVQRDRLVQLAAVGLYHDSL